MGIVVFFSINGVITPPSVSIPSVKGVTSNNRTSDLSPLRTAPCVAAPKGTPQIEVTFDIDANGKIDVSAKDKSSNKEQSITIQGGSGLSDDEIEKMVKDAEANAEEDKKFEELVASRNMADSLASATKKAMDENADELSDDEKKSLTEAISGVE